MITYTELKSNRRKFLALTGLTPEEFQQLLTAFRRSYERRFPSDQTMTGRPRQRFVGGGRRSSLEYPEQKLLFILVYLKTYSLQVVLGELFDMSQPRANQWIHRLLPILRDSLDELGFLPERTAGQFARKQTWPDKPTLIIDATERRRQRPKNPEKQALFYSGKKKTHTDKNVVIVPVQNQRVEFLSPTYAGKTHEKKIVDREGIVYPPDAVLYKDTGFQGYEPLVKKTYQPKKKDTHKGVNTGREADQSKPGKYSCQRGACPCRR
jgi:Helix-turn-helix of DDE superfamily endonuclease/DDE superfamily endonuclease